MNREGSVFIFGAGASKAEKAPIASELLSKTLIELRTNGHIKELREFLKEFFYVNTDDIEVLTMVDIGLEKQENFSAELNCEKLTAINNLKAFSRAIDESPQLSACSLYCKRECAQ